MNSSGEAFISGLVDRYRILAFQSLPYVDARIHVHKELYMRVMALRYLRMFMSRIRQFIVDCIDHLAY